MKAHSPRRRAERLVTVDADPNEGVAILVGARQIGDRVAGLALAEADAAYLRRILTSEFRKVRRAALRTAARRIRNEVVLRRLRDGEATQSAIEAAELLEHMAAPKRSKP